MENYSYIFEIWFKFLVSCGFYKSGDFFFSFVDSVYFYIGVILVVYFEN